MFPVSGRTQPVLSNSSCPAESPGLQRSPPGKARRRQHGLNAAPQQSSSKPQPPPAPESEIQNSSTFQALSNDHRGIFTARGGNRTSGEHLAKWAELRQGGVTVRILPAEQQRGHSTPFSSPPQNVWSQNRHRKCFAQVIHQSPSTTG